MRKGHQANPPPVRIRISYGYRKGEIFLTKTSTQQITLDHIIVIDSKKISAFGIKNIRKRVFMGAYNLCLLYLTEWNHSIFQTNDTYTQ